MLSNVKKKDMPLIAISLVAILFIAATLKSLPSAVCTQSTQYTLL